MKSFSVDSSYGLRTIGFDSVREDSVACWLDCIGSL